MKTGLVLSGGGARGAYQVGVLKAVADLHPKRASNPFSIITGTSAGAINAVALAASANNFRLGVKKVERIWSNLELEHVIESSGFQLMGNALKVSASLLYRGVGRDKPLGLLNNAPLGDLLSHNIRFSNIQRRIDAGYLEGVAVTATSYASGNSITFFQGKPELKRWHRSKRIGIPAELTVDHLMGSSAIPGIFPAQRIGRQYFGDGSLRHLAPLSPSLKLGADKIMVIGLRGSNQGKKMASRYKTPSLAQTMGHIFSSAFIDSLESDLENMLRINELLGVISNEAPYFDYERLKPIDMLVIRPSIDFEDLAVDHIKDLPWSMRKILRSMGAGKSSGGNLVSYLMFESAFCLELIEYGYKDAMDNKREIQRFFDLPES